MDRDRPASAATPANPEPAAADPLVIEVPKPQLMPLVSVIPDTIRWMPPPAGHARGCPGGRRMIPAADAWGRSLRHHTGQARRSPGDEPSDPPSGEGCKHRSDARVQDRRDGLDETTARVSR